MTNNGNVMAKWYELLAVAHNQFLIQMKRQCHIKIIPKESMPIRTSFKNKIPSCEENPKTVVSLA